MHRLHDRRDLLPGLDARRIEAIGAGFRIGLQPVDHHGQIGLADQKAFAAAGQQHAAVVGIDRRPRRLDALDRESALVQRLGGIAGEILDRQPGNAGLDRARDIGATFSGSCAKPPSKSALTGRSTAAHSAVEMCAESSSVMRLSALPIVQAKPALVEASALKPRCCSAFALPTS